MSECAACGAIGAPKKCSACKQVVYCGKECQKAHFKVHKKQCAQLAQGRGRAAGGAPAAAPLTAAAQAAQQHGLEMDDEDLVRLKTDFDAVCRKYDFQNDAMSSKLADFLSAGDGGKMQAKVVADEFGMELQDANTFLMWIQIGTKFKADVIDQNAQLMREGKL